MTRRRSTRRRCRRLLPPTTWTELLADYDVEHAINGREEAGWYASQSSLTTAIRTASSATNREGKRFDHQWRIRRDAIAAARDVLLLNEEALASSTSFAELIDTIEHLLLPISGLGELYCYDCASRLGAYLGLEPDRIYLHRGTRVGARVLHLEHRRRWLWPSELPEALRVRSARELESILCIYAHDFSSITAV